ncbi:MAG TPA: cytochrome c oxidase subunit I [Xanthobacteraceae bacterium]|nr:cytochrome c oxidase subunit I [Xanthobacteraceae bacterium]
MSVAQYDRLPEIAERTKPGLTAKLQEMWETPPGLLGWISSVDHKDVGRRYLVTSFLLLIAGGIQALIMRLQLAGPNQHLLTPEQYDELFTMHGSTMIIWYAFPVLSGFSNFLWPLIFGSRDMAFPRLNAFSYWVFLASAIFLYVSFAVGSAPNAGWFNYVPYASRTYNPGINIDFFALANIFFGISTTAGAVNFVVTTLRTRCPGMSVNRFPIVAWGTLTANAAAILANPVVSLAFFLLWLDRTFGSDFYGEAGGQLSGHPLLWQHLFWMWGHPWVYMIVLPAQGMVSDIIPTFCRRPLVGYTAVVLATVATMMLGFGVWVHHMFATGLTPLSLAFFSAASLIITIPSGIQVFSWIATIWTGRPVFRTPMLYAAGFIFTFVIGGVSGFMTAVVPVDWQLTDTYFVVAHLHYVLIGINFFGVMAAIYYWFPKMTGRMLSEKLGQLNFWLTFIGFNVAFFPMHISGLMGMPRRIYTYDAAWDLDTPNLITTIGAFILALGILVFFLNVIASLRSGERAGPNPWDAPTLEWSVPSPPPPYNFTVIPSVASRHPLWERRLSEGYGESVLERGLVLDDHHETLGVTALDGEPDVILKMPSESYMPFVLSLCISAVFAGLLIHLWWLAGAGAAVGTVVVIAWLWPRAEAGETELIE